MSRRGSVTPGAKKSSDAKRRAKSDAKEGKLTPGDPSQGDIFYKTVRIYPSVPDHDEDVTVTSTKPFEPLPPGVRESPPSFYAGRRSASDRRTSTFPTVREDTPEEHLGRDRWKYVTFRLQVKQTGSAVGEWGWGVGVGGTVLFSALKQTDYWPTGRAIDPVLGAWYIKKFISLAQVVPGPV